MGGGCVFVINIHTGKCTTFIFMLLRFGLLRWYNSQENTGLLVVMFLHVVKSFVRSFIVYSIHFFSLWILLFEAIIASSWSPLSRVSALYRYCEYYGLVYVINIHPHNLFLFYKICISEHYSAIVGYSRTPGQQVSAKLWNIIIIVWLQ